MSVILFQMPSQDTTKKARTVTIYKNEVYRDIDLYTHKFEDASGLEEKRVRNAISADSMEDVDGAIIARNVSFREAQLRRFVQFALADKSDYDADDRISIENEAYVYHFLLDEEFNDNMLQPLADHMHRFLVWGALYDWYMSLGTVGAKQAASYKEGLDAIEDELSSMLRGSSIAKRPLQPFGPQKPL